MRYQVRYQTVDGQDEHFAEAETFLDAVLRSQPLYNIRRTERRPFIRAIYILHVPISKQAADELAHAKRVPDIPSPGEGQRTAAYDAIMRPTARARVKANAILQED